MLEKPKISDDAIIACLHASFGLRITQVSFLPFGWIHNALYRLTADNGTRYLLKLRHGPFHDVAVTVPAFLPAQGIRQVIAPIATTTGRLWVNEHDFYWTLYPFFDGKTGFEVALSKSHWIRLGQSLKAIHMTSLPAALAEGLPQEDFSPRWRNIVRAFHKQIGPASYADPTAARLAAFWMTKRDEILCIAERAELLADGLQRRPPDLTVSHGDLHGRNVLVSLENEVAIVDWDEPMLAAKERDLMFIGGGIGGIWNNEEEVGWFYQGYSPAAIDLFALCYYRYERIVKDIAEYSEQIFGLQGSDQERQKGLGLMNQFLPNNVVEIAHRSYQRLMETHGE